MDTAETSLPSDIRRLSLPDREIILIGTAHISRDSVETVRQVIDEEQPDTVCVELDHQRYEALRDPHRWRSLNLIQVLRRGQGAFLLANLALAAFQKKMGLGTGVQPGAELAAAAEAAEQQERNLRLIDRNIRTTLLRIWRQTGWWKKLHMFSALLTGMFDNTRLDEEQLTELRQGDTLSALLEEMGSVLPGVKTVLVDERDRFMAFHIQRAPGRKIVAVVGAAHLPGILANLQHDIPEQEIEEISQVPPKSRFARLAPWLIPGLVIALFAAGFFWGDRSRLADAATAWILANGLLSALGALIALGHPLTVLTAFVAAPLTSLNPAIGAGMVTGLVQACLAAPTVQNLENVGEDIASLRGWWRNRLTRVLMVFFLSNLGSTAGTFAALHWLKDLI
jgi:pheromone shutdown-related protein TraB